MGRAQGGGQQVADAVRQLRAVRREGAVAVCQADALDAVADVGAPVLRDDRPCRRGCRAARRALRRCSPCRRRSSRRSSSELLEVSLPHRAGRAPRSPRWPGLGTSRGPGCPSRAPARTSCQGVPVGVGVDRRGGRCGRRGSPPGILPRPMPISAADVGDGRRRRSPWRRRRWPPRCPRPGRGRRWRPRRRSGWPSPASAGYRHAQTSVRIHAPLELRPLLVVHPAGQRRGAARRAGWPCRCRIRSSSG